MFFYVISLLAIVVPPYVWDNKTLAIFCFAVAWPSWWYIFYLQSAFTNENIRKAALQSWVGITVGNMIIPVIFGLLVASHPRPHYDTFATFCLLHVLAAVIFAAIYHHMTKITFVKVAGL